MLKLKLYYTTLTLVVCSLMAYTIYQGSVVVTHGQKVAKLEHEKTALQQQHKQLQQQLATTVALQNLDDQALAEGFQPITQPIVVTGSHSLAAVQ